MSVNVCLDGNSFANTIVSESPYQNFVDPGGYIIISLFVAVDHIISEEKLAIG